MSILTDTQKHSAMYYGGTTQKKAKAAMRRTATHLAAVQDSLQLGTLGPLKPDELATLAHAAQIMRRLADLTEHAGEEADRIKTRIDHRRAEALSALNAAPVASTADQVALIALGSYPFELRSLARDCAEFGAHRELPNKLRDARQSIAWDAAKSDQKPADFIAAKLATLPTVRQAHDTLIRQIEQIVETQTAERESRKAAA
jgi:hypothetical protein